MKPVPLFFITVAAFIFSFMRHISFAMYPLSFVIFYFYIPKLYAWSRINVLWHHEAKEFMHLRFYPSEFIIWLVGTCFFAFIIAHLLADFLFDIEQLSFYILPAMGVYLVFIVLRELKAKDLGEKLSQEVYEQQGRMLSVEILMVFLLLLAMH